MYKGQIVYAEDIECILEGYQGKGGIFIGNLEASQNLNTLRKHSIKGVLTSANGIFLNHPKTEIPHYMYVPAEDHENFSIAPYFDKAAEWIHQVTQQTNVLVHCMAGVSRSVSLVLAYLIKYKQMSYNEAYSLVKSKRRIIHPNDGFIRQLKQYEMNFKSKKPQYKQKTSFERVQSYSPRKQNQYFSPSKKHYSPTKMEIYSPSKRYINPQQSFISSNINHQKSLSRYDNYSRNRAYSDYKPNQDSKTTAFQTLNNELDRKIQQIRKKYQDFTTKQYPTSKEYGKQHIRNLNERNYDEHSKFGLMRNSGIYKKQSQSHLPIDARLKKLASHYENFTYSDSQNQNRPSIRKLYSYQQY